AMNHMLQIMRMKGLLHPARVPCVVRLNVVPNRGADGGRVVGFVALREGRKGNGEHQPKAGHQQALHGIFSGVTTGSDTPIMIRFVQKRTTPKSMPEA